MIGRRIQVTVRWACRENGVAAAQGIKLKNWTPWLQSESELYLPSDARLSVKLVPTFTEMSCLVSATDPRGLKSRFSRTGAATFPFK
jgi:hypothetical protein